MVYKAILNVFDEGTGIIKLMLEYYLAIYLRLPLMVANDVIYLYMTHMFIK